MLIQRSGRYGGALELNSGIHGGRLYHDLLTRSQLNTPTLNLDRKIDTIHSNKIERILVNYAFAFLWCYEMIELSLHVFLYTCFVHVLLLRTNRNSHHKLMSKFLSRILSLVVQLLSLTWYKANACA